MKNIRTLFKQLDIKYFSKILEYAHSKLCIFEFKQIKFENFRNSS